MESTSEHLDENVERIVNGEGLEVTALDAASEQAKAVTLRKTVCYIVSAVIFNTKGEVLMVQEVKRECYGHWYLPAGRMEAGESIIEALQREVREEAGVDCRPITLLLVQERGPRWIRFAFLAEVTGGNLKTTAEADFESLQAQWWDREAPLPLRSQDILALIDAGIKYRQRPWFPISLPTNLPCHVVCQRLLFTFTSAGTSPGDNDEERLWLLLGNHAGDGETETRPHLPIVVTAKTHTFAWAGLKLLQECLPSSCLMLTANIRGVLGVQHSGRVPGEMDGICFNTLATLEHLEEGANLIGPPPLESESYRWHEVTNQSLRTKILQRIKDMSLLPVHSL
ncbi:8-oxo-dGDP phosphatase NUDT18 isoform X1 [Electrophorus electricus]|uniref:8-oxo-dGDP phosphatase NUDT18 n=1 Tax=Electrophorus electricus TaxID=8005 RepID=A0A4W4FEU1_ELEEL|nr:8-oxo-dGDP phosphatase NUDT18 isoform X1 [Electrophorus electricus]